LTWALDARGVKTLPHRAAPKRRTKGEKMKSERSGSRGQRREQLLEGYGKDSARPDAMPGLRGELS
jgi:hypothetical protein